MPRITEFGSALAAARRSAHVTQRALAQLVGVKPTQVYRWELRGTVPGLEMRMRVVKALADAPRETLDLLADASEVSLENLGLVAPPAPAAPTVPAVAQPAPKPASALDPSAQTTVDDALREAAEDLDVSPALLRPALSRMLDRIARVGVPTDAAARMVLGVPKKTAKPAAKDGASA